jgi:hypothetical protein
MIEGGFAFGTTAVQRVWQIYVAHILLFVFYLASVHFRRQIQRPDFDRSIQCRPPVERARSKPSRRELLLRTSR